MILRVFLIVFYLGLLSLNTSSAFAANTISAKAAAEIVQKQYGGKVLKVDKQKSNGNYKVKIITSNGQVSSKSVNSTTGAIQGEQ